MPTHLPRLEQHQQKLRQCHACPQMFGPPVTGQPVVSSVMLVGQAPGNREIELHRPFAWTAGKTLFKWFAGIGLLEDDFRQRIYMAAVCRCFPGKKNKGGDRVPNRNEIKQCAQWLANEVHLLQPSLVLPVGKLAISQYMPVDKLQSVIGQQFKLEIHQHLSDVIPLPHPSGASTWHHTQPGKQLLQQALSLIAKHKAWKTLQSR